MVIAWMKSFGRIVIRLQPSAVGRFQCFGDICCLRIQGGGDGRRMLHVVMSRKTVCNLNIISGH
jgi:hypothetical protein